MSDIQARKFISNVVCGTVAHEENVRVVTGAVLPASIMVLAKSFLTRSKSIESLWNECIALADGGGETAKIASLMLRLMDNSLFNGSRSHQVDERLAKNFEAWKPQGTEQKGAAEDEQDPAAPQTPQQVTLENDAQKIQGEVAPKQNELGPAEEPMHRRTRKFNRRACTGRK